MAENEYQRPEGKVLGDAMKRSGKSARKIAPDTGLTDSRLRHIVNGYQPVGQGQKIVVVAPAETLARVAQALGVSADQLDEAGRSDAADLLRDMPEPIKETPEPNVAEMMREILQRQRAMEQRLDELARNQSETG